MLDIFLEPRFFTCKENLGAFTDFKTEFKNTLITNNSPCLQYHLQYNSVFNKLFTCNCENYKNVSFKNTMIGNESNVKYVNESIKRT